MALLVPGLNFLATKHHLANGRRSKGTCESRCWRARTVQPFHLIWAQFDIRSRDVACDLLDVARSYKGGRHTGAGRDPCQRKLASEADQATWDRAQRPKACKRRKNCTLAHIVADKLRMLWSPGQIVGWL